MTAEIDAEKETFLGVDGCEVFDELIEGGGREGGNGDWFGSVRLSLTHSPGLLGLPRQCMPGFLLSPKYIDNHSGKDQQPRC